MTELQSETAEEVEMELNAEVPSENLANHSFVAVYDCYFDQVNRYLRYRVKDTWDADDLTAQVFTKAFEHFDNCRNRERVGAWIFQIAHNTYVDYLRKRKEHLPLDDQYSQHRGRWLQAQTKQPEEQTLAREEIAELKCCLEQLPQEQRDVLLLKYFGELQYRQIADILGKKTATVKTMGFRALQKLRSLWERKKEGGWPG
jgi:RNA polymerase sigma-70 factor (ECF subfamily)